MFGLFRSDVDRVRKLRTEFEDIRQRVIYKMNPYEQYSFGSGYEGWVSQFQDALDEIGDGELEKWRQAGEQLRTAAQKSWNAARRTSGIAGEGAVSGAEALALLALRCATKGYQLAEALTLQTDIATFEAKIAKFMNEREPGSNEWFPRD